MSYTIEDFTVITVSRDGGGPVRAGELYDALANYGANDAIHHITFTPDCVKIELKSCELKA
jgi:hypothetical protein